MHATIRTASGRKLQGVIRAAREKRQRKERIPAVARVSLTMFLWLVVTFGGAAVFQALEGHHERILATENAYLEESAGLRSEDWRKPPSGIGCLGDPFLCDGLYSTREECEAVSFTAPGNKDENCDWFGDVPPPDGHPPDGGNGGSDAPPPDTKPPDGGNGGSDAPPPDETPPGGGGGGGPPGRRRLGDSANITDALETAQKLLEEYKALCKQAPPTVDGLKWTYRGSLFFAMQVVTTVGYGTFAPQTDGGRAFTVVFGIFGIAVTGYSLGVFTSLIDGLLELGYDRLLLRRHGRGLVMRFKVLATTGLLVIYLLLVALYTGLRYGLKLGTSIYFAFITVSTIGLGDETLGYQSVGDVVLQYLIFYPGLALFAEFIALGGEASRKVDEAAMQRISHGSGKLRRHLGSSSRTSGGAGSCGQYGDTGQINMKSAQVQPNQDDGA